MDKNYEVFSLSHKVCFWFYDLKEIFRIYNEGNPNLDMPIFNGGLFDDANTKLLQKPKIFDNLDLIKILDSLFHYEDSENF